MAGARGCTQCHKHALICIPCTLWGAAVPMPAPLGNAAAMLRQQLTCDLLLVAC